MASNRSPSMPLGAVRTDNGDVVIPESRRADGSVRKQIRIRQGYVPQDQVPKYKTIAQRRREQDNANRNEVEVVEALKTLCIDGHTDSDSKQSQVDHISKKEVASQDEPVETVDENERSHSSALSKTDQGPPHSASTNMRNARNGHRKKNSGNTTNNKNSSRTLRIIEL